MSHVGKTENSILWTKLLYVTARNILCSEDLMCSSAFVLNSIYSNHWSSYCWWNNANGLYKFSLTTRWAFQHIGRRPEKDHVKSYDLKELSIFELIQNLLSSSWTFLFNISFLSLLLVFFLFSRIFSRSEIMPYKEGDYCTYCYHHHQWAISYNISSYNITVTPFFIFTSAPLT